MFANVIILSLKTYGSLPWKGQDPFHLDISVSCSVRTRLTCNIPAHAIMGMGQGHAWGKFADKNREAGLFMAELGSSCGEGKFPCSLCRLR